MPERALEGMKVIDLTHHIAGPYCTKLLADLGADVIKVERPGGDEARRMPPFFHDEIDADKSLLFLYLNTNKRGITLNLKTLQGKEMLKELVRGADMLVENFSPRVMPGLGLDYETLREINPSLVMTSISNFMKLRKGWRPTNLGWRGSMWRMPPWPRLWVEELPEGQRKNLKIPDDRLALLVKLAWGPHVSRAGIRKHDVLVSYDGRRKRCTPGEFHTYVRLNCYRPKSRLKLTVLRRGREQDIAVRF